MMHGQKNIKLTVVKSHARVLHSEIETQL